VRGNEEGTTNGSADGYRAGWDEAYPLAFAAAFELAYPLGIEAGYATGLPNGFKAGWSWAERMSKLNDRYGSYGASVAISVGDFWEVTTRKGDFVSYGGVLTVEAGPPPDYDWSAHYFDLGFNDGESSGNSAGLTAGYDEAYPIAYAAAYEPSNIKGLDEGKREGELTGSWEGYHSGWNLGYDEGHAVGWDAGVEYYLGGNLTLPAAFTESHVPEPSQACLVMAFATALPMLRRRVRCSSRRALVPRPA
jgi:hypothetical protein